MDAPRHTLFRRLISKHFIVKKLEVMRPRIQALVDEHIDHIIDRSEPFDFVEEIALPVPSTVIAWLLGVPPSDHPFFNRETEALDRKSTRLNSSHSCASRTPSSA